MSVLQKFHALRPSGGFGLIMADPPWRFDLFSDLGEEKSPQRQYDCMALADICALPVEALAAEDCLLWLWATNPMLPQALEVMAAWGFEFRTAGTWVKRTKTGKDAMGTGYVFRSANEPILIGARGRPRIGFRSVRSTIASYHGVTEDVLDLRLECISVTIDAVRRRHSEKPEAAYAAAEKLRPDARRIELFSRTSRPGWACWGDEVGKFDAA